MTFFTKYGTYIGYTVHLECVIENILMGKKQQIKHFEISKKVMVYNI